MSIEQQYPNSPRNGKVFAGLILLVVGGILLLQQIGGFLFPSWLISFPMFLIVLGTYICIKHHARLLSFVLIFIGLISLADDIVPSLDLSRIIWPGIIIFLGFWLMVGRRQRWNRRDFEKYYNNNPFGGHQYNNTFEHKPDPNFDPNAPDADRAAAGAPPPNVGDGYIDIVSVFGGVKRTILSKDFKGGEIVNICGGTELDLTQADINGQVTIDITQLFGGIKLTVPPHWQVVSDLAAVFSNVDDKRRSMQVPLSADKILIIKGVSLFAGVDVRSF